MHNISLEQFYKRINRQIAIVGAYTGNEYLPQIIKACRLKPITAFSRYFTTRSILERTWIDEFGNLLEIKKKTPQIKFGAVQTPQITTDIYRNASIEFIVTRSKFVCFGWYNDNWIIVLWGSDNYWRAWRYVDNQLIICSPLTIGMRVLQSWIRWHTKTCKTLRINTGLTELQEMKWIIGTLPAKTKLLAQIDTNSKLRRILANG